MINMFKLPVCPYCGKAVRYTDSKRLMREKRSECRSCHKRSAVKYKAACVKMGAVFAALLIGLNTLMFFKGNNKTLLPNLIVTVSAIFVYMILTPLTVRLTEIEGQREDEPKLKKNRHRHKKTKYSDVSFEEDPLKGTSFDNN